MALFLKKKKVYEVSKKCDRWSNETKTLGLTFVGLLGFKALASITCFGGFCDLPISFSLTKSGTEANSCHVRYQVQI